MRAFLSPRRLAALAAIIVACDLAVTAAFLWYANAQVPPRDVGPFDGGVVFFADESSLGDMTKRNLSVALELYRARAFPRLLMVGGARPASEFYGAEDMKAWMIANGVPEAAIDADRNARGAKSSWSAIERWIRKNGAASVTIVSDPAHHLRLRRQRDTIEGVHVSLNTYSFGVASPPFGLGGLWYRAHYEFIAISADLLIPDRLYEYALGLLRR